MSRFLDFPKFIIYGTGIKTEELIRQYGDKVYGLMDNNYTHELVYGKYVLDEDEIIKSNIKVIVIVARKVNIPIIYRRIEKFCSENDIAIYDMDGNVINMGSSDKKLSFDIDNLNHIKSTIREADVVSFDIFDTLIMRSCLYPTDVFEIAGTKDINRDYNIIYKTEYDLAYPRSEIITLYDYARLNNKEIYLVSDMYLKASSIQEILRKCSIDIAVDRIIVSCEYDTDKTNNLFKVLKNKCGSDSKIVHIGDSYEADYVSATKNDLTAIQVDSRLDILQKSKYHEILNFDKTLDNRLVIAELLISKFELADIVGPLIYKFITWIKENSADLDMVLLGARDGWLIDLVSNNIPKYRINSLYFLTSRTAAVSASLYTDKDIEIANNYPFSGEASEMYKKRFGLEDVISNVDLISYSSMLRSNYLAYFNRTGIKKNTKVGFVDLVSMGTCYYSLKKILPLELFGLFAVKLGSEDAHIRTLYVDADNCKIMANYLALEEIFTSYMPTLKFFDSNGDGIYFEEKRSEVEIENIQQRHYEIIQYGKNTLNIDFSKVDLKLCDDIFGILKSKEFLEEDEFCGR